MTSIRGPFGRSTLSSLRVWRLVCDWLLRIRVFAEKKSMLKNLWWWLFCMQRGGKHKKETVIHLLGSMSYGHLLRTHVHTYLHACMQTYACKHTYIRTYIHHSYIHTYIHACIHTYLDAYIHAHMQHTRTEDIRVCNAYIDKYIHTYMHTYTTCVQKCSHTLHKCA